MLDRILAKGPITVLKKPLKSNSFSRLSGFSGTKTRELAA